MLLSVHTFLFTKHMTSLITITVVTSHSKYKHPHSHFALVIATKSVHQFQNCPKSTTRGHSLLFPKVTSGSVQQRRSRSPDRQTQTVKLKSIKSSLTKEALHSLVQAFVHCRLDYCNYELAGVARVYLLKHQSVQNMAARVVSEVRRCDHITQVLEDLKIYTGCQYLNEWSSRWPDNDWVKKCTEYEVVGSRPRGRPKRTWLKVVQRDCQVRGLSRDDAVIRGRWRKLIRMVISRRGVSG